MKHGVKIEESRFLTSYMLACLGVIALCCVNYVCAQSLSEELNNFNNGLDALPQVHYVTTSAPSNHDHQTFLVKKVPIWPIINVVNHREILEAITNKLQEYLDVDNRTLLHQSVSAAIGDLIQNNEI